MIDWIGRFGRRLRAFRRGERGTASVEFVIIFPVLMTVFLSSFELAVLMVRDVMLERAVDLTVRDLRLGRWTNEDPAVLNQTLKDEICDRAVGLENCNDSLLLELVAVPKPNWPLPDPSAGCIDRVNNVSPVVTFQDGPENEMMIVRACAVVDTFFPSTEFALMLQQQAGDGYALVVTTGYVNEPR